MDEFNLGAYLSAIMAVATPLFAAIVYIIKKGGPYVKKWLEKVVTRMDDLSDSFKNHTEEEVRRQEESQEFKEDVMERLLKGDSKFDCLLEQMNQESKEQKGILEEMKRQREFTQENRERIVILEEETYSQYKERFCREQGMEEINDVKNKENS